VPAIPQTILREHVRVAATISLRLAEEFSEAVRDYIRWSFGNLEPSATYRHLVRISLVCGRVHGYSDPLPDDVLEEVNLDRLRGCAGSRLRTGLAFSEQGIFLILSRKQGACTPTSTETSNFSKPFQRLRASGAHFPVIRWIRELNNHFREDQSPEQGRHSPDQGRMSLVSTAATKGCFLNALAADNRPGPFLAPARSSVASSP
jgi:hypothetical protein